MKQFIRGVFAASVLALAQGCSGNFPPIVIPTPPPGPVEPTPPPPVPPQPPVECLPGVAWCHELVPPASCSSEAAPCKHNPSSDPSHCEMAPACVVPSPPPVKPPTPPPTSTDPPSVPLFVDEELVADPTDLRRETFSLTHDAVGRWRAKHPEKWDASGSCLVDRGAGIDAAFAAVAAELGAVEVTAAQSIDKDGKRSDCIFVCRPGTNRCEETHLYHSETGCVASSVNTIKMVYIRNGTSTVPTGGCSAPIPPKCDTYNLKAHQKTNDATCLVYNGETHKWDGSTVAGYCDAVGFVNRMHCPPRMECDTPPNPRAVKCEERSACEAIATSGKPQGKPVWKSDGTVNLSDNPFLATCDNCTWLELCNADGTGCGRCTINKNTGQCPAQ